MSLYVSPDIGPRMSVARGFRARFLYSGKVGCRIDEGAWLAGWVVCISCSFGVDAIYGFGNTSSNARWRSLRFEVMLERRGELTGTPRFV